MFISFSLSLSLSLSLVDLLDAEQYARVRNGTYTTLFKLEKNQTNANPKDSFLLTFYQDLFSQLKQRLKVDIAILDFNLVRLRQCIEQVVAHYHLKQTMLNLDELPTALEFFLQIDGQ